MSNILPFSFLQLNNGKCKFIDNVEKVLNQDIQSPERFGCKIINCHTHAGSKIHFKDFVEAELLFHNSYYNQGFAYLTVQEILTYINEHNTDAFSEIVLVGYETYSELYLQEVKRQLEDYFEEDANNVYKVKVSYCVYESYAENKGGVRNTTTRIRNLFYSSQKPYFTVKYGFCEFSLDDDKQEKNPLCVFIVPINTTLTTMDKMMSMFKRELGDQLSKAKKAENSSDKDNKGTAKEEYGCDWGYINNLLNQSLKLCLITIEPNNTFINNQVNEYWDDEKNDSNHYSLLKPKKNKFTELKTSNINGEGADKIISFAKIGSQWQIANGSNSHCICEYCFPDKHGYKLIDEKPIFDVTRGSVVPMLQLGKSIPGEPAKQFDGESIENLNRVANLMAHMSHRHLSKGDDHFQYYFDTMGFLSNNINYDTIKNDVNMFINNRVKNLTEKKNVQTVVYNYIIAPRHDTNAKWVDIVNATFVGSSDANWKRQFGTVRTLYFDITKEYRSNLQSKYSDFYREIRNIIGSESYTSDNTVKIEIRFHFVDITIASGQNFIRAADLVHSLLPMDTIERMSDRIHISLFDSIFLLYCRSSKDSREFYSNLFRNIGKETEQTKITDRFYSYVKINISHMRSHEDACTLCRLKNDYRHIQEECATNSLAGICDRVITKHEITAVNDIPRIIFRKENENNDFNKKSEDNEIIFFHADKEKQYLFLISHIINERLSVNRPLFNGEDIRTLSVECESEYSVKIIETVLNNYYNKLIKYLGTIGINEIQEMYFKNAFIKSISRPFFTFHIRKRQAAFSFCLQLLEEKISEFYINTTEQKQIESSILINTLVKALCDMNSNYLIRSIQVSDPNTFSPFDELVQIAEKGDELFDKFFEKTNEKREYVYKGKDWFTTNNYLHHIKKMLSLSQDKTKSVLLESILVNGCEDGFWGSQDPKHGKPDISYFLCGDKNIKNLSLKGKLYLENNKVIIDALYNLQKSNKDDKIFGSYFFDNFKEIVSINHIKSDDIIIKKFKTEYEKVLKLINNNDLSDLELCSMMNSIWSEDSNASEQENWNVTTFLRDTNVTNNNEDFNKIFEFLHFSSEPFSDKKNFYNDGNFEEIRKALENNNNNNDVLFVENGDKYNVLVRFADEIQTKPTFDKLLPKDNSIYIQIRNFNNLPVDWFRLKILLTLRSKIVELIKRKNIPEYIRQKHNEAVRRSLSLAKSAMHGAMEDEFTLKFFNVNEANEKNMITYGLCKTDEFSYEIYRNAYFKHFTLLSDELIASWYRKIIRIYEENGEKQPKHNNCLNFGYDNNGNIKGDDFTSFPFDDWNFLDFKKEIVNLFGAIENDSANLQLTFPFFVYDANDHTYHGLDVYMDFVDYKESEDHNISFVKVDGSPELRNGLFLLLVILFKNAYKHGNAEQINVVFDFSKKQISISNKCKNDLTDDWQDKIHTLPLTYKDYKESDQNLPEPSISLWTIIHLFKMQGEKENKIEIFPQNTTDCYFQIIIKNALK